MTSPYRLAAEVLEFVRVNSDADSETALEPVRKTGARIEISAPADHVALGDRLPFTTTMYDKDEKVIQNVRPENVRWTVSEPSKAVFSSLNALCSAPCETQSLVGLEVGTVEVTAAYGSGASGEEITGAFRVTLDPGTGGWGAGFLYGTTDNEGGENIASDDSGNVYVGGATAVGGSVPLVSRFLPNGKHAWTRVLPGVNFSVNGIALAKDGGVFVGAAGVSYVDAAGRTIWDKAFPGSKLVDVASDKQGNVYITGGAERQYKQTNPICPGEPDPSPNGVGGGGASDGYLMKLDATGKTLWCKAFTYIIKDPETNTIPVAATFGTSIEVDEGHGVVYLGGLIQSNVYYGLNPFLLKFDKNTGATEWMKFVNGYDVGDAPNRLGSSFSAEAGVPHGIALDGEGNVWNSVYDNLFRQSNPNFTEPPIAHIVKVSPTGQELLRLKIKVSTVPDPGNIAISDQPVRGLRYRAVQNDMVLLAEKQNNIGGNTSVVMGINLDGSEKWRETYTSTPQIAGKNSSGLMLRDVTALPSGDIFAVGETFGDFADMKNQTRELTNLQTLGSDIVVVHVGARP